MRCSGIEFDHDPMQKNRSLLEDIPYLGQPLAYFNQKSGIKEWLQTFIYVCVFYIACTTIFIEGYQIPSGSMEPTFHGDPNIFKGDRIFALKWISRFFPLKRGDIIIFISVEDQETFIVKRLVGFPGDTIHIKNNQVYVNAKPLTTPPFANPETNTRIKYYPAVISMIKTPYSTQKLPHELPGYASLLPYTVPKDCYFVMGDNSASSNDSRYWGFLPKRNVLGKATMIWWPLPRAKILNHWR